MTLIAKAIINQVDSVDDDGAVIIRAIAESDAIKGNSEGDVTAIEIFIHCPVDPGLQVGAELTVTTHFVKVNPDEPQTPVNTVGDAAVDAPVEEEPVVDDEPAEVAAPETEAPVAEVPAGEPQPTNPDGTPIPTPDNAPDGPGLGQVDKAVPADAGPISDPNSLEGGYQPPAAYDPTLPSGIPPVDPAAAEAVPPAAEAPPAL